jgi:hypothetical protein
VQGHPMSQTSPEKERLLVQEGYVFSHDRTEQLFIPGAVER